MDKVITIKEGDPKDSGLDRERVPYATEEMTETRLLLIRVPGSWLNHLYTCASRR